MAVYNETFNQPNSTTLGPVLTWSEAVSDWETRSQRAHIVTLAATGFARDQSDTATSDQYTQLLIPSLSSSTGTAHFGVCVRFASAATTFYQADLVVDPGNNFGFGAGTWYDIQKTVAGTSTALVHIPGAYNTNDVIRLEVSGTALNYKKNGVSVLLITDASITTGTRGGMASSRVVSGDVATGAQFETGDLFSVAPPAPKFTAPGRITPAGRFGRVVGTQDVNAGTRVGAAIDLGTDHGDIAVAGAGDLWLTADLQGHGDNAVATSGDDLRLSADLRGHGDIANAGAADITVQSGSGNAVALTGHGDIANAGQADLRLAADVRGHGDIAVAAQGDLRLAADLRGHGDNANGAQGNLKLSADLRGHGDAAVGTSGDLRLAADLRGHGDAANAAQGAVKLSADLQGHGDISTAGTANLILQGRVDLSGAGAVANAGSGSINLTASLSGHGDNAVVASAAIILALALTGVGANSSAGSLFVPGPAGPPTVGGRPPSYGRYSGKRPELAKPKPRLQPRPYTFESDIERLFRVYVEHYTVIYTRATKRAQLKRQTGTQVDLTESADWIAERNREDEMFLIAHAARLIEVP